MKLYTEDDVKKAILFSLAEDATMEKILDLLTPIELPSNEEIKERRKEDFKIGYNQGFLDANKQYYNETYGEKSI